MDIKDFGQVLAGNANLLPERAAEFASQPIDEERMEVSAGDPVWRQTTIGKPISVTGAGTFFGKAQRTLHLLPSVEPGWRFDRSDLPNSLHIEVSVRNVWTTVRNIVLCSGSPHNYMRMVEHIVALKYMGLDNLLVRMDAGDPPLFDRSSMDLVEAVEQAGIVMQH